MEDWLLLEDGRLLNPTSGIVVQFRETGEHEGKATVWGYGVILCGESLRAGLYFGKIRDAILNSEQSAGGLEKKSA